MEADAGGPGARAARWASVPGGVANTDQAEGWDGDEGAQWVAHEERYEGSVRKYTAHLLDAAEIGGVWRVLDVGCGCGETTRDAARRAATGEALGIDLSARMVERARERSAQEGVANARFVQGDAQTYPFAERAYDAALSRFGAMFFEDPVAAFRNIYRAVRPEGRLVLLAWQELAQNEWLLVLRNTLAAGRDLPAPQAGTPGPFGLADPDGARRTLEAAGFKRIDIRGVREPVRLGADAADALRFARVLPLTERLLAGLDAATATRVLDDLQATLAAHETAEGVLLGSAAWLITAGVTD